MIGALEALRGTVTVRQPALSGQATRAHLYAPRRIHFAAAQRLSLLPGAGATPFFTVTALGPNHESERELTERAHDLGIDPNLNGAVSLRSKMFAVERLLEEADAHGLATDALRFVVSAEACVDPMTFGALARTRAARHLLMECGDFLQRFGLTGTVEYFQRELEGTAGILLPQVDQTDYTMRALLHPWMAAARTSPQFWPALWDSTDIPRRTIPVVLEGLALQKPLLISNVRTEAELQFLRATSSPSLELFALGPAVRPSRGVAPLLEQCPHCDGWVLGG